MTPDLLLLTDGNTDESGVFISFKNTYLYGTNLIIQIKDEKATFKREEWVTLDNLFEKYLFILSFKLLVMDGSNKVAIFNLNSK